jgi:hypothetical protein
MTTKKGESGKEEEGNLTLPGGKSYLSKKIVTCPSIVGEECKVAPDLKILY